MTCRDMSCLLRSVLIFYDISIGLLWIPVVGRAVIPRPAGFGVVIVKDDDGLLPFLIDEIRLSGSPAFVAPGALPVQRFPIEFVVRIRPVVDTNVQ